MTNRQRLERNIGRRCRFLRASKLATWSTDSDSRNHIPPVGSQVVIETIVYEPEPYYTPEMTTEKWHHSIRVASFAGNQRLSDVTVTTWWTKDKEWRQR